MSSPGANSNFTEPKRKRGICLPSNPVLQNSSLSLASNDNTKEVDRQYLQSRSSPSIDSKLSAGNNRQQCDFITFKGLVLNQEQRSNEMEMKGKGFSRSRTNSNSGKGADMVKTSSAHQLNYCDPDGFHTISLARTSSGAADKEDMARRATSRSFKLAKNGTIERDGPGGYGNEFTTTRGSEEVLQSNEEEPPFKFAGIFASILTSLFVSLSMLLLKLIPNNDNMQEKVKALWFRGALLMILCGGSVIYNKSTFIIQRSEIWINVIRSSVGCFGSLGAYASLQYITVGESTALVYSSPVWTSLLSYLLLKEPLPLTLLPALPFGLFSIIMIAQPDLILGPNIVEHEVLAEVQRHHHNPIQELNRNMENLAGNVMNTTYSLLTNQSVLQTDHGIVQESGLILDNSSNYYNEFQPDSDFDLATTGLYLDQRLPGILMALGTSLVMTTVCIVLKFNASTPIQTTTFYLGVATVIVATLIQCIIGFGKWPDSLIEYSLLIGVGLCSWIGQILFQWALKYEKASICCTVRTFDVVMSFVWSALFLKEDILWTSVLGGAIIICIVILLMLNKYIENFICSRCRS